MLSPFEQTGSQADKEKISPGKGIGRELIRRTHEAAGLNTGLILLAAPKAQTYYPHIGLLKHQSCWTIPSQRRG
jgi:hypothetical protein